MRNAEKNLKVSCTECIHRRRILTCHEKGNDCTLCKNACCCRKCSPDASGQELDYEKRRYFSPGMPMSEYAQAKKAKVKTAEQEILEPVKQKIMKKTDIKKSPIPQEKQDVANNLITDKNGQLSFLWDE